MDIHDLSLVVSHDIIMELEKTLFQSAPSLVNIVWPHHPTFARAMHQFLFQTEVSLEGYRIMHPMTQLFECPQSVQDDLLTHLLSQSEYPWHSDTLESIYAIVRESSTFMRRYSAWLREQHFFSRVCKAYDYLCHDTWSFFLAAFAPDFLDGPFWDRFSIDISDEIVHSMSMFQIVNHEDL